MAAMMKDSITNIHKEDYTSISQAVQDSWDEVDVKGEGLIDISQFLTVVERVAGKVGKTREELFSEKDMETYRKFRDENKDIQIFRDEFERLFEGFAGCELNSQILQQKSLRMEQNDENNDPMDVDDSISHAIQPPIDTSTPLVRRQGRLPSINSSTINNKRSVLEELDLNNNTRQRYNNNTRMLSEKDDQIKYYESQIAELEKEKTDLKNNLKKFQDQVRDLKNSDIEKDTHIRAIETDLHETKKRLESKVTKPPSPPRNTNPDNGELNATIQRLKDKITLLEREKAEMKRSTEELMDQISEKQEEEASSNNDDTNIVQRMNIALETQRKLLAQYSDRGGTVFDGAQGLETIYLLIGFVFIMILLAKLFFNENSIPWWVGTLVEAPAAAVDSWIRGSDIYPI